MFRKLLTTLSAVLIGMAGISGGNAKALSKTDTYLPPFLKKEKPFNLIFVLDRSGSMWSHEKYDIWRQLDKAWGIFKNDEYYCWRGGWDGYWIIPHNDEEKRQCSYIWQIRYFSRYCDADDVKGNLISGRCLNYNMMKRIDIMSYLLTGGAEYTNRSTGEKYIVPSIEAYYREKVRLEDSTLYDPKYKKSMGLIDRIYERYKDSPWKPHIAVISYSDWARIDTIDDGNPDYGKAESKIYRLRAEGSTNQKDAFKKVRQVIRKKNFYRFNGHYVYCAKNFVIHMSDGWWNDGGDPLKTVYNLWKGGDADVSSLPYKQNTEVFTIGAFMNTNSGGARALMHQAVFGGFTDEDGNDFPCNYRRFPKNSLLSRIPPGCIEWDKDNNDIPDNFRVASSGEELYNAFSDIISQILKRMAGSGISVSPNTGKAGSVAVQSLFGTYYETDRGRIKWGGDQLYFWIYSKNEVQNVREDTVHNYALDLTDDYILEWVFGDTLQINLYQPDENGDKGKLQTVKYSTQDLTPIVSTGEKLAEMSPDSRKIMFVNRSGNIVPFDVAHVSSSGFKTGGCIKNFSQLVDWVKGRDVQGCREHIGGWKLADSIYSQPVIVKYDDYYVAFIGSNDGMVHAFKIGYIGRGTGNEVVKLTNSKDSRGTDEIGKELWAFIPYEMKDKLYLYAQPDYQHIWGVDGKLEVVETDVGKKYLIVSMGWGGKFIYILDITDPESPKMVKKFHGSGLANVGFALVKKGDRYYVVEPMGNVDTKGEDDGSYPYAKIVGVNVDYERTIPLSGVSGVTGDYSVLDYDGDGNSDAVVFSGYKDGRTTVYVLDTRNPDPNKWAVSRGVTVDQPISGGITAGVCFGRPFIYFGTGRWFTYEQGINDPAGYLYGIPLIPTKNGYTMPDTITDGNTCTDGSVGWRIALEGKEEDFGAERVITNPVLFGNGEVIFTSIKPPTNVCAGEGKTRFWALNCATGQSIFENCQGFKVNTESNQGSLIAQLTTGNVVQIQVSNQQSSVFTKEKGKATEWVKGIVPTSGTGVIKPFSAVEGKIIFLIER